MQGLQGNIRNALLNGSKSTMRFGTNNPHHADDARKYFSDETKAFFQENLKYASNVVTAQVQGINYDNFYEYKTVRIRTSSLIDSTTGLNLASDWQRIIVEDQAVDFLPRGAKVCFNGDVWLVVNPSNIESVSGTSVIHRCNATWRRYDDYGNVIDEPFIFGQGAYNLATKDDRKEEMILMAAYQHCIMQLNPESGKLRHNSRMILGTQAFQVRGLQSFVQEFSTDIDSNHIQFFDVSEVEPLEIDDIPNRIAEGKHFYWNISLSTPADLTVGKTCNIIAESNVSGFAQTVPYNYLWMSTDPSVATVDSTGKVTAVSVGETFITCTLAENRNITAVVSAKVAEAPVEPTLEWANIPPDALLVSKSETFSAVLMQDGVAQPDVVTYTYSGANSICYTPVQNDNTVTLYCNIASIVPLTVTATCRGQSISKTIQLQGW